MGSKPTYAWHGRILSDPLLFFKFIVMKNILFESRSLFINSHLGSLGNIRCCHDILGGSSSSSAQSLLAQVKICLEGGPSYFESLTPAEKEV